jgi:hypothetical protein
MTRRVSDLSDADLKSELSGHGYQCGPITGTTRRVLERKLEAFRDGKESILTAGRTASKSPGRQPATKKALIEKKSSVSSGGKAAVRPPRTRTFLSDFSTKFSFESSICLWFIVKYRHLTQN